MPAYKWVIRKGSGNPVTVNSYRAYLEQQDQETLDELVQDAKANEAAEINNAGKEAQVRYLLGPDLMWVNNT